MTSASAKRSLSSVRVVAALTAIGLLYFFLLYLVSVLILFGSASADGANDFRTLHLAATGRFPPARLIDEKSVQRDSREPLDKLIAEGRQRLSAYAYVKLQGDAAAKEAPAHCGWLLHEADNRVLMLTSAGLMLISFGDEAHAWVHSDPEHCSSK